MVNTRPEPKCKSSPDRAAVPQPKGLNGCPAGPPCQQQMFDRRFVSSKWCRGVKTGVVAMCLVRRSFRSGRRNSPTFQGTVTG